MVVCAPPLLTALQLFLSVFSKLTFSFQKPAQKKGDKLGKGWLSIAKCEAFMGKHPECMIKLYQRAGDVVHVPPGWLHSVFTLQASAKVAWDYIVPESLHKSVAAWAHVGTQMETTTQDYMAAPTVLVEHAKSRTSESAV